MAAPHENTIHAKIRDFTYRLTDGKGSFSSRDVYQSCNRMGLVCTKKQVDNALRYYARINPQVLYKGSGWYVWLRKEPK